MSTEERAVSPSLSEAGSLAESSSCESPPSPLMTHDGRGPKGDGRRSPPSHLPPPPHQFVLGSGNDASTARESSVRSGGRFPVGALAPGMVYNQPTSNQHPGSFLVSLNGAPHYLSFPLPIAPPTDLSKSSPK